MIRGMCLVGIISVLSSRSLLDTTQLIFLLTHSSSLLQMVTDQNPEDLALMTVREKFLDYFKQEIPYTLKFSIEYWDLTESGELRQDAGYQN